MKFRNRAGRPALPRSMGLRRFRYIFPLALVGVLTMIGMIATGTAAGASHPVLAQAEPPPPTCVACPSGYHCVHNPEGCEKDEKSSKMSFARVAQNANYVACHKLDDNFKDIRFRWCPKEKPWTATNDTRSNCYISSEACAEAEMPQSWCIKCEGDQ